MQSDSQHHHIATLHDKLLRACRAVGRAQRFGVLLTGASVLLLGIAGLTLAEHPYYLPAPAKTLMLVAILAAALVSAWTMARRLQAPGFESFYHSFTRQTGQDDLRYLIDLYENRRNLSSPLYREALRQNYERIQHDRVDRQLSAYLARHPVVRSSRIAGVAAATLVVALAVTGWSTGDALQRALTFWHSHEAPIPYAFTVEPGDTTIEQGTPFTPELMLTEGEPDEEAISIGLKTEEESDYRYRPMEQTEPGRFTASALEPYSDLQYHVRIGGHRSETYTARVQMPPRLQELTVTVHPPGYTGLEPSEASYPLSSVDAYPGSHIRIDASANKPLARHTLVRRASGDSLTMEREQERYQARFPVYQSDTLHFELQDEHELANRNRFGFRVNMQENPPPSATFIEPEPLVTDMQPEELDLVYDLQDEFGFSSVTLHYEVERAFAEEPETGSRSLNIPSSRSSTESYTWSLDELDIDAGDQLEYWIEVTDNNEEAGYRTGASERQVLRVESLAERIDDQQQQQQQVSSSLDQAQQTSDRIQQELEAFREQLRTGPDDEWEQSQILDQVEQNREELQQQVSEMQNRFDELTRDLREAESVSEETMRRYEELRHLMDQIEDPDIMDRLRQMQQNLDRYDQSRLREELDGLEFDEQRYRERLERTAELFRQIQLESDLDGLAEQIREQQERQQQLMEQADELDPADAQRQQSILDELTQLEEQLDELPEDTPQRMQQHMQDLSERLRQRMEQAAGQMQENLEMMEGEPAEPQQLQEGHDRAQQQLGDMARDIEETGEQMTSETIQVNLAALQNILDTLILLSDEQEDIVRSTRDLDDQSSAIVDQARRQRNVEQNFRAVTDSLRQVAREIPQYTNHMDDRKHAILQHMQEATERLADRDPRNAVRLERQALGELNEMASQLADLVDQLRRQSGGQGGGMNTQQMMEQMQQMAGEQQQVGQQLQDMINDMQGERLTRDRMERLEQMARQQREMREQLREMQHRGLNLGDELQSELERLGEQMEESINELRGGSTDDLMVDRQQNILSRMLQASDAMEQREPDSDERVGETAEDYERSETAEYTLEELQQVIRSGLQDEDRTPFSEDYQKLIQRYFELLQELHNNDPVPEQ